MTTAGVVRELRAIVEERTTGRHRLRRVVLAPGFSRREGSWNGRPIALETDIFVGTASSERDAVGADAVEGRDGRAALGWAPNGGLERLHIAEMRSEDDALASLTVLAIPTAGRSAPILGLDVVAFGGAFSTAVLELHPAVRPLSEFTVEALGQARARLLRHAEPREQQGGESPFSEHVTFCAPSRDAVPALLSATRVYASAFAAELAAGGSAANEERAAAAAAQDQFLARLSQVKKQMRALGKLFGQEWLAQYFDDVFLARKGAFGP